VRDWHISGKRFELESQESMHDSIFLSFLLRFFRHLQAIRSAQVVGRPVTQTPEVFAEEKLAVLDNTKGLSHKTNTSLLHQSKGLEMPEFMNAPRSAASSFRFCQSISSAKTIWDSRWFLMTATKCVLSQFCVRTTLRPKAIGLPQTYGEAGRIFDISNNANARGEATFRRSPLTSLCVALFAVMSYAVAGAQTTSTTMIPVTPASAGYDSVFTMTATVTSGTPATALTGGTVTFRDTYNGVTLVLGTVQVQSANGTAVLHKQLGGIGTHSIVATFNPFKPSLSPSSSTPAENATVVFTSLTSLYPTTTSLVASG
jgi:hypothetical protein